MIATDVERLEQVITEALMNEWEAQGHFMNGRIVKDIEFVVKQEANKLILQGYMYPYGNIQAAGVKANKIPFSGRTGRGGTSLYIQALQRYAKNRMNVTDDKKALSIAFAIAHTQKKQGMPTQGSYRYSQTGKRTGWVEESLKDNDKVNEAILAMAYKVLSVQLDVILNKWNYELNN